MSYDEDRKIIAAATPGPWRYAPMYDRLEIRPGYEGVAPQAIAAAGSKHPTADAVFIARARTAWPEALDRIERLEALLKRVTPLLDCLGCVERPEIIQRAKKTIADIDAALGGGK